MKSIQEEINLINVFKLLIKNANQKIIMFDFDGFTKLREKIIQEILESLSTKKELLKDILKPSTFELMAHNFRENTHSNILKYLFLNSQHNFGSILLGNFIEKKIKNSILIESINKKKYTIEREKPVSNGRIDLFIIDHENKFLILIENKLLAKIATKDINEVEAKDQLELYYNYITKKFPSYLKTFILLSYYTITNFHDQYYLFTYLELYEAVRDLIQNDTSLKEYQKLLRNLLYPIKNKAEILNFLNNHDVENKNISISDLYYLKTLTNEYKTKN